MLNKPLSTTTRAEIYEYFLSRIDKLVDFTKTIEDARNELIKKFSVVKTGDTMHSAYDLYFGKGDHNYSDKIATEILNTFLAEHKMNTKDLENEMKKLRKDIEFMMVGSFSDQLCEVDILSMEPKLPTQCS